ncbi:hypothetical protein [Paraburkholderia caffeinilytica]|uniref:hypothetical protein n=1 Tax=Paraburkholderia caffeinilytica TaxID=1761016 RepID=UPI0038BA15AB
MGGSEECVPVRRMSTYDVACGQISISALYGKDRRLRCAVRKTNSIFTRLEKIVFSLSNTGAVENHIDSDADLQYLLKKKSKKCMNISC